jgi:hypothetical protein
LSQLRPRIRSGVRCSCKTILHISRLQILFFFQIFLHGIMMSGDRIPRRTYRPESRPWPESIPWPESRPLPETDRKYFGVTPCVFKHVKSKNEEYCGSLVREYLYVHVQWHVRGWVVVDSIWFLILFSVSLLIYSADLNIVIF